MNRDQHELWNGPAGRAWVESQSLLDGMFRPFEQALVEAAVAAAPGRLLDVGCGTGATTRALARSLGQGASCIGVDLSEPMIDLARRTAAAEGSPARFVVGDAQSADLPPGGYERIVSRFGVMFFDDPVAAFSNLRRQAAAGAALEAIAWRSAQENPLMTTAESAAAPLLPGLVPRQPGAPGQFAFADPARVRSLLGDSGWSDAELQPLDRECSFPQAELLRYIAWMGPVGVQLQKADEATRRAVTERVRQAFEPFVKGDSVCFTAACWRVTARA